MKALSVNTAIILILITSGCHKNQKVKPFWPKEKSPEVIGQKLMDDFFTHDDFQIADSYGFTAIHYAETCASFGVARLADAMHDKHAIHELSARYLKVITDSIPNTADHVDANVYGILPFELYRLTGEQAFFNQAKYLADVQWENPRSDGLSNQTRFWIDDVWMIGSLQIQAYRITGNPVYIERAALEIDTYLKRLQQTNGLFYHGPGIPFHWGRGNGWVAVGLTDYVNEAGKVTDVCVGTGQHNDIDYYLNRPRITGDFHGQAPMMWFAWSLISKQS